MITKMGVPFCFCKRMLIEIKILYLFMPKEVIRVIAFLKFAVIITADQRVRARPVTIESAFYSKLLAMLPVILGFTIYFLVPKLQNLLISVNDLRFRNDHFTFMKTVAHENVKSVQRTSPKCHLTNIERRRLQDAAEIFINVPFSFAFM